MSHIIPTISFLIKLQHYFHFYNQIFGGGGKANYKCYGTKLSLQLLFPQSTSPPSPISKSKSKKRKLNYLSGWVTTCHPEKVLDSQHLSEFSCNGFACQVLFKSPLIKSCHLVLLARKRNGKGVENIPIF